MNFLKKLLNPSTSSSSSSSSASSTSEHQGYHDPMQISITSSAEIKVSQDSESQVAVSSPIFSPNPDKRKMLGSSMKIINLQEFVQKSNGNNITCILPREILLHVFSYLNSKSLLSVSAACKLFYVLSQDLNVWKAIAGREWNVYYSSLDNLPVPAEKNFNWKEYCRFKHLLSIPCFMKWKWISPKGSYPIKRHCHTGTNFENEKIIYIGGQRAHDARFNDVYHFDVNTHEFTQHSVANVPNFSKHTAIEIRGLIYVFGGFDGVLTKYELAIYDPQTLQWRIPKDVKGDRPLSRSNHRVAVLGTKMYLFGGIRGGADGNLDDLNDLYVLETTTLTWRKIEGSGPPPAPRSGHLMAGVGNKLYVFGGGSGTGSSHRWDVKHTDIFVFDTETEVWSQPAFPSSVKKNGVCIYSAYFSIGPFIFVFGGEQLNNLTSRKELSKDLYVLDTVLLEWRKLEIGIDTGMSATTFSFSSPRARDTGVMTCTDQAAYLSHGYNAEPLSDMWELKFKLPLRFSE